MNQKEKMYCMSCGVGQNSYSYGPRCYNCGSKKLEKEGE